MQVDDWSRWCSLHLGHCLTPEQRAACRPALLALAQSERVDEIQLIGKILGIQNDYLVAVGLQHQAIHRPVKYFYSVGNGILWARLPTESAADEATLKSLNRRRFQGDPAFTYEGSVTEEQRLSGTIILLDKETAVVPRGAWAFGQQGEAHRNPLFDGLDGHALGQLDSYLLSHAVKQGTTVASVAPKGSWSILLDESHQAVFLRSLHWPGQMAYYAPSDSHKHGWAYVGTGQKSLDIGFQLA